MSVCVTLSHSSAQITCCHRLLHRFHKILYFSGWKKLLFGTKWLCSHNVMRWEDAEAGLLGRNPSRGSAHSVHCDLESLNLPETQSGYGNTEMIMPVMMLYELKHYLPAEEIPCNNHAPFPYDLNWTLSASYKNISYKFKTATLSRWWFWNVILLDFWVIIRGWKERGIKKGR